MQYPDWLSENKASMPADEYSNYEQQYTYMKQICEEFEQEADSDSDSEKTQRFAKVMNLMQEVSAFNRAFTNVLTCFKGL